VLGDLVPLATRHLKRGDKIRLTGLGILLVRKRHLHQTCHLRPMVAGLYSGWLGLGV
jgi:hypothetical protein